MKGIYISEQLNLARFLVTSLFKSSKNKKENKSKNKHHKSHHLHQNLSK